MSFGAFNGNSARRSVLTQAGLRYYQSPLYLQSDTGNPYSTYGGTDYGYNVSLTGSGSSPSAGYSLTGSPGGSYRYMPSMPGSSGTNKYDSRVSGIQAGGQVLSSLVSGIFGVRAAKIGASGGQQVVYEEASGPNWGLILGGVAILGVLGIGIYAVRKD